MTSDLITRLEGAESVIPALPDLKSLSGHSAYCKVCWEPYYRLWSAKEDHGGVCIFGHTAAHDCPQAMSAARLTADLRALQGERNG